MFVNVVCEWSLIGLKGPHIFGLVIWRIADKYYRDPGEVVPKNSFVLNLSMVRSTLGCNNILVDWWVHYERKLKLFDDIICLHL